MEGCDDVRLEVVEGKLKEVVVIFVELVWGAAVVARVSIAGVVFFCVEDMVEVRRDILPRDSKYNVSG